MDHVTGSPAGLTSPPVFTDGFGSRFLAFDPESATPDPIEILAFEQSLVDSSDFAAALGTRVARLAGVRHTFYARVRRLDRPTSDSLHLVSDRMAGWRLARILEVAEREKLTFDISAVLSLLRQLIPAVTLFARHQKDLSIGALGPERLIVTRQGRLVLAEYVLGPAIEKLMFTRERLWRTLRVAVPAGGVSRVSPRSDVLEIGIVVLSLLYGRRLRDDEFPDGLGDLLQRATESSGGNTRPLSPALSSWLARALQLDARTAFQSPHEAQVAFEEMLATERGYVTTPALLDAFLARFAAIAGPLPEPVKMTAEAPPAVVDWAPAPPAPAVAAPPIVTPPIVAPPIVAPPIVAPPIVAPPIVAPPVVEAPRPAAGESGIFRRVAPPPSLELRREQPEEPPPPVLVEPLVPKPVEPVATPKPQTASGRFPAVTPPAEPAVRVRVGEDTRKWTTGAIAGFALVVLLEAVVIIWLWSRGPGDTLSGEGELVVQSRPPGAQVTIDRQARGVTPLTVRLSPGTHVLEVRVGTDEPRVIPLQIRAGVQTVQYLELQTTAANPSAPGKGRKN